MVRPLALPFVLLLLLPHCAGPAGSLEEGSSSSARRAERRVVLWNEFWLENCNASAFPLGSFGIAANARNAQNGAVVTILGAGSIQGQHRMGPFLDWPKIEKDGDPPPSPPL